MRTRALPNELTMALLIDSEVDALFPSSNNEVEPTPIDEDPPPNSSPPAKETEIVFEDNNAYVAALPTQTSFPFHIPSTSKVLKDLRLSLPRMK